MTLLPEALMGTAVTATLEDPDGSISRHLMVLAAVRGPQHLDDHRRVPPRIPTLPRAVDVGHYLRATVSYTDGEGSGKSARATTTNRVPNRPPDFGANKSGAHSRREHRNEHRLRHAGLKPPTLDGHDLTYTLGGTHAVLLRHRRLLGPAANQCRRWTTRPASPTR